MLDTQIPVSSDLACDISLFIEPMKFVIGKVSPNKVQALSNFNGINSP